MRGAKGANSTSGGPLFPKAAGHWAAAGNRTRDGRQHRQIRIPPRLVNVPLLAQYSPLRRRRTQLPGRNYFNCFS